MQVKRIVANFHAEDISEARRFYRDILGLDVLMDHGWIVTYGSSQRRAPKSASRPRAGQGRRCPISRSKSMISTRPCSG